MRGRDTCGEKNESRGTGGKFNFRQVVKEVISGKKILSQHTRMWALGGKKALHPERMAESIEAAKILVQRNNMGPAHCVQPSLKHRVMKEVKPPKKSEKEQNKNKWCH